MEQQYIDEAARDEELDKNSCSPLEKITYAYMAGEITKKQALVLLNAK